MSPLAPLLTSSAQTFPAGIVCPASAGQHLLIVPSSNVAIGFVQTVGLVGGEKEAGAATGALVGLFVGDRVGDFVGDFVGAYKVGGKSSAII